MNIVGTCIDPAVIILPPDTLPARACTINGTWHRVVAVVRLADGHVEWRLSGPHGARAGDAVVVVRLEAAPSLAGALDVAADYDEPAGGLFGF